MSELAELFARIDLQQFLENTQTLIALINPDGRLLEWNPAFERLKKLNPGAELIQDFLAIPSKIPFSELTKAKEAQLATVKLKFKSKDNNLKFWLTPVPNNKFLFFAEPSFEFQNERIAKLTSDLERANHALMIKKVDLASVLAQANEISHTDSLTFLPNRRQIIADLQRQVIFCDEHQKPLTIFLLDIDHFKRVNDSYGHMVGDHVLRTLASRLLENIREGDKAGRYGGEEFLILLPGTNEKSASKVADRLLKVARDLEIRMDEHILKITVSIGIAEYRIGQENWEKLFERADLSMYQSKQNGRDQWTISEN